MDPLFRPSLSLSQSGGWCARTLQKNYRNLPRSKLIVSLITSSVSLFLSLVWMTILMTASLFHRGRPYRWALGRGSLHSLSLSL